MPVDYLSIIDRKQLLFKSTSDFIWEHPETAFTEYESAACLLAALREEGFEVEEGLAGIPTAFLGRFGSGRPVIGILGEFDALSGLGQESPATERSPDGKPCGHGCGHNLLGAASLAAAVAVKAYLESSGKAGTVIYFGCPGEEGGSGKTFMVRDGVFDGVDAAIGWHPDDETGVRTKSSLANCQVLYKFDGTAAHAAIEPYNGRSALDAMELMNVGANFLREHIIPDARLHYAITDAGGLSPNVVQPHAEVLYLIRAPHSSQVSEICSRVDDIARGAALMAGVTSQREFIKACSEVVLNSTLSQLMYEKCWSSALLKSAGMTWLSPVSLRKSACLHTRRRPCSPDTRGNPPISPGGRHRPLRLLRRRGRKLDLSNRPVFHGDLGERHAGALLASCGSGQKPARIQDVLLCRQSHGSNRRCAH